MRVTNGVLTELAGLMLAEYSLGGYSVGPLSRLLIATWRPAS
ncbi:MAG: hypothetical protein OXC31_26715 [Spirochaetaceae bacterium]|nr:hypothetical protein [Spirochaetaceae bacterium]